MATALVRWCDLCLADETESPAQPYAFAFDGHDLETDLCDMHGEAFKAALGAYAHHARTVGQQARPEVRRGRPAGPGSTERQCPGCAKVYHSVSGLAAHVRSTHTPAPDPAEPLAYPCPECDRSFTVPTALGAHRKAAHGVPSKRARPAA